MAADRSVTAAELRQRSREGFVLTPEANAAIAADDEIQAELAERRQADTAELKVRYQEQRNAAVEAQTLKIRTAEAFVQATEIEASAREQLRATAKLLHAQGDYVHLVQPIGQRLAAQSLKPEDPAYADRKSVEAFRLASLRSF